MAAVTTLSVLDEVTWAGAPVAGERTRALARAGAGSGTRIAYLGRTAPEVVELLFATSKLGAVTVPLNWRLAPRELAAILADAGAPLLIADAGYAPVARELAASVAHDLRVVVVGDGYEEWLAAHPPDVEHRERRQADRVAVEGPTRRRLGGRGEVAVGGQHALRDAGGPGRVHLDHRVARLTAMAGVVRPLGRKPLLVAVADDDHVEVLWHSAGEL